MLFRSDQEMDVPPPAALPAEVSPVTDSIPTHTPEGALLEMNGPMDHSDPRHPDYGKPDPTVEPEDPVISHHVDPTPAPVAIAAPVPAVPAPAPGPEPVASDPEKKAG